MKLFRFMSQEEFKKYCEGAKMLNTTKHNKEGYKTSSVGFCFFNYAEYKPEEMLHSVFGVVNCSICAIFETTRDNVIKSKGRYSRAIERNSIHRETFLANEYCTKEYDKNTFRLIKWAIPDWFNWDNWDWKEEA